MGKTSHTSCNYRVRSPVCYECGSDVKVKETHRKKYRRKELDFSLLKGRAVVFKHRTASPGFAGKKISCCTSAKISFENRLTCGRMQPRGCECSNFRGKSKLFASTYVTLYSAAMHGQCYWNIDFVFSNFYIFLKRMGIKWRLMIVMCNSLINKDWTFSLYVYWLYVYLLWYASSFLWSIFLMGCLCSSYRRVGFFYITYPNLLVVGIVNIFSHFVTCHFILSFSFWWTKIFIFSIVKFFSF